MHDTKSTPYLQVQLGAKGHGLHHSWGAQSGEGQAMIGDVLFLEHDYDVFSWSTSPLFVKVTASQRLGTRRGRCHVCHRSHDERL